MEMTDKALNDFAMLQQEHQAASMIWEGDPSPENVTALAAQGVSSLVINPCGNQPAEGDWLSVMKANLVNLEAVVPAK